MDGINDPAWFYSSLAQTTAAIVGLIGAVLGSRIIDHIGVLRAERKWLDGLIANALQRINGRMATLTNHRAYLVREIAADDEAIEKGMATRPITHTQTLTMSTSSSQAAQVDAAHHKQESVNYLQVVDKLAPIYTALSGPIQDAAVQEYADRLREAAQIVPHDMEDAGSVASLMRSDGEVLAALLAHVVAFRQKLLPGSFKFVFVLLVWLSGTGIIWPLLALPGLANSYPKAFMMASFVIGLLGLAAFFAYQFIELVRLGRLRWRESR